MTTVILFFIGGLALSLLAGVAKGSVRRLSVAAAMGMLVAFAAFPFNRSSGFLSRETVDPTLLALIPSWPLLALIPLAMAAVLWLSGRGGSLGAAAALGGSVVAAGVALLWMGQAPSIGRLSPVFGLMEAIIALALAGSIALLALSRPQARVPILVAAAMAGVLGFLWFSSPQGGGTYLARAVGYYKLVLPTPAETRQRIVDDYNRALPELNAIRKETGQGELAPINGLEDLQGRIPGQAAQEGYRLIQHPQIQYGAFALFLLAGLMFGAGLVQLRNPRLEEAADFRSGLLIALIVCILIPSFEATEFDLNRLANGAPFFQQFFDRAWPPLLAEPDSTPPRYPLQDVLSQIALTIEMALVGTFLAAILAMPVSFLAARNVTAGTPLMRGVFFGVRTFLNVLRGIPTLIIALVLVAGVGLGPFAGVLAIAIHSFTELGKLYSEAIENVDKGPIEALESTGTAGVNVVRWGILPQVLPLFVSYTVYNFEINFRSSLVLGLVGAGGIGYFINEKMASGQYNQMIVGVIAIVIVVNLIDFASSWLRSRLV